METSPMETDEVVVENPVEPENKSDEIAPVEVSETRAQPPEIEKSPVQQVNMLDVTKLSYELQQGYRVFIEMSGDSYKNVSWPFMEPVDAEGLGLWDYHEKIKQPMSFNEIGCKFNKYEYTSITEVISDIRLILENCYRYNGSNHWVSKLGHKMEKILEQKLALLNRSLRDKVSLEATMALKSDFVSVASPAEGTGRRRTAPRNSYVKMINGEDSSSLLTRLKIQEDIEERERRRIREKEKKEANLVLLQDLAEWEENELGTDVMKELHSMWEIPSLAGLLFLLKDFLYIQDLSITELELSFVYANKSSLLARIFTALLITPHQRKSLFKKSPMKFKVWESKLCDRVSSWYKATEKDGQELTCHQYGLDMAVFEVLGEVNPLLEKSYMDLTLHQRVWILKCLCDNSLVRDYDFRDHLGTIAPTDQRELFLGNDANNWSYLYFPIFSSTDLRIYKQCPLDVPTMSKRKKKVTPPPPPPPPPAKVKPKVTPARAATPTLSRRNTRLRKLRSSTPSPEPETPPPPPSPPPTDPEDPPEPKNTIPEGFELTAYDIETLKKLCEKFDEPPPTPKKRGRKPKPPPPRKRCEVELHQMLLALLEELEKYEVSFSKVLSKAKIKIMKESQEPELEDEPEEVIPVGEGEEWGSEESIGDEIEDAGAQNMSSDEDFILDDEEGRRGRTPTPNAATKEGESSENKVNTGTQIMLPQKRKAAEEGNIVEENTKHSASAHVDTDNDPCSISIQTAPLKLKKKRKKSTATPVPQPLGIMQANQQLSSHVPSGLQVVKDIRPANVAAVTTAASVNKNIVSGSCINTAATGGVFTVGSTPSTNITQTDKNMTSVRIHPKPVILNKSSAATKHSSSNAVPKPHVQSFTSAHAVAVSRNLSSTSSSIGSGLQSQAGLSAAIPGVGKVLFVTSSGVPLQVLKAVPVSQQAQGKTLNTAMLGSTGSPASVCVVSSSSSLSTPAGVSVPLQVLKAVPVSQKERKEEGKTIDTAALGSGSKSSPGCAVSSSSSISTPTGVSVLASSSLHAKSTSGASHLPSSPIQKVVMSAAPNKLANILSTSKQTSHIGTASASPLNPPVIFVQRPGAGGVVPVAIKGGAIVMSAPSASQQVVVIRPSSALASSTTTSTTTHLSGTGISVLGNKQITQTALGQKVVLAPTILKAGQSLPLLEAKTASVVTGNKSLVQVAMAAKEMKPSEAKTTSISLGSKPVVTTTMTTATATASPTKAPTTTVTVAPTVLPTGKSLPLSEAKTTSVVTDNKSLVQVAMAPKGMKPFEAKTTSIVLGNKPVVTTTMTTATASPAKAPTTTVTVAPTVLPAGKSLPQMEANTTCSSVSTDNKPLVQVPIGMKPSEPKTTAVAVVTTTTTASQALSKASPTFVTAGNTKSPAELNVLCTASPTVNKQVPLGTTTSSPALSKAPTTTVTMRSNSTVLVTTPTEAKSICAASPACNQKVALGSNTSADVRAPNEQSSKVESHCVCNTEVSRTKTKTVALNCNTVKVPDTQTVSTLSPHTDLQQNVPKCEDNLLPSKTIPLGPNCEPEKLADICIENNNSTGGNINEMQDPKNCSEQLLDLTCYETSVSDSAGCEESDDSDPNGLHPDTNTTIPSKLIETDVKLCNGVASPLTQDKKCEEKELDSVEQNHTAVADQTSNGVTISKTE